MPKQVVSLKSLISALSRSFVSAQEEMTWSQLASLLDFFHKDGTSKNLKFIIPKSTDETTSEGSKGTEGEQYEVPILSLIAPSPLHIAEGKMEFNVAITDINYKSDEHQLNSKEMFLDIGGRDGTNIKDKNTDYSLPMDIMVDTSSSGGSHQNSLSITMKVKAAPHQDGYDRFISKMSQLQGILDDK